MILKCTCGGTTTVTVDESSGEIITECACGKVLRSPAPAPATLTINVSDGANSKDAIN